MILSCVTIAATVPILTIVVTDPGFTLSNGTFGMDPMRAQLMDSQFYWIIPGIISLTLLSSLPRPRSLGERLPKKFGIVALVLSALCILYPVAMLTFSGVMFFIGIAVMTL
nr:hypothetical protein WG33_0358 [uncultured bacterium]